MLAPKLTGYVTEMHRPSSKLHRTIHVVIDISSRYGCFPYQYHNTLKYEKPCHFTNFASPAPIYSRHSIKYCTNDIPIESTQLKWWVGLHMCWVAQSVQRLATGWTVRESNPSGGEIFRTCPDQPWNPPSLLYIGYRVFPGGKERPGREADPSQPSSPVVLKGQSYTSTPPIGRTACTEPQCLYKGDLYFTYALT